MNKRGQVFLIGAFVVVSLLISFKSVYNIAKSDSPDLSAQVLPEEIASEGRELITNRIYFGNNDLQTILPEFIPYFIERDPSSEVYYVYFKQESPLEYIGKKSYCKKKAQTTVAQARAHRTCELKNTDLTPGTEIEIVNQNLLKLNINGNSYEYTQGAGGNFNLLVIKEKDSEKTVIVK